LVSDALGMVALRKGLVLGGVLPIRYPIDPGT